jgi:hypothetical protein
MAKKDVSWSHPGLFLFNLLVKKSSLKNFQKSEETGAAILTDGDGLTDFFLPEINIPAFLA